VEAHRDGTTTTVTDLATHPGWEFTVTATAAPDGTVIPSRLAITAPAGTDLLTTASVPVGKVVGRAMREYVPDTVRAAFPAAVGDPLPRPPQGRVSATDPAHAPARAARAAFIEQFSAVYRLAQERGLPVFDALMAFYNLTRNPTLRWVRIARQTGALPTSEATQ
jgi:hypothetical protein